MSDDKGASTLRRPCTVCGGSGEQHTTSCAGAESCPRCEGTGRMSSAAVCCGIVRFAPGGYRAFCNACGWEGAERSDADVVVREAANHG